MLDDLIGRDRTRVGRVLGRPRLRQGQHTVRIAGRPDFERATSEFGLRVDLAKVAPGCRLANASADGLCDGVELRLTATNEEE